MTDGPASVFNALGALGGVEQSRAGGGGGGRAGKQKREPRFSLRVRVVSTTIRYNKGQRLASKRINNVVKARYIPSNADAKRHIVAHTNYIQNRERAQDEPERKFFNRNLDDIDKQKVIDTLLANRGRAAMFKLIFSPDQNELDHEDLIREIMARFEEVTGIVSDWFAVKHANTDHHHVHVEMPGRDIDGNSIFLKPEHLDAFREIANEHQYELQDRNYDYEKEAEAEFDPARSYEDALRIWELSKGRELMQELDPGSANADREARALLGQTNFDPMQFRNDLQKELAERALLLERMIDPEKFRDEDEYKQTIDKFRQEHPELCDVGQHPQILLKNLLAQAMEKLPEILASYSPETEKYYLARLNEHIAENPKDADKYEIDPANPEKTPEMVIKQFLNDNPQLAPELALDLEETSRFTFKVENIDLDKIPSEEKIIAAGQTYTKFHPLDNLNELNKDLLDGRVERIPHDKWLMLGTWLMAKEMRGDDVYGKPPLKEEGREWKSGDIDLEKIPDQEKIFASDGSIYTRFHTFSELGELNQDLLDGHLARIDKDQWRMLGTWLTAKTHQGDDAYGRPPCKGDPEPDPEKEAIDAITRRLLDYNAGYIRMSPILKYNPAEMLHKQLEKIQEWYPTFVAEFKQDLKDFFSVVLDEFPEFLPGNESDFARSLYQLEQAAELEKAEKDPASEQERGESKNDLKKSEPARTEPGDPRDEALNNRPASQDLTIELARQIYGRDVEDSDLNQKDAKELVGKFLKRVAKDPEFIHEVKGLDPKEFLWKLSNTDEEWQYEEQTMEEHTEALVDQIYAPADLPNELEYVDDDLQETRAKIELEKDREKDEDNRSRQDQ